ARPRLRAEGAAPGDRPFRREGPPPLHAGPERRQRARDPRIRRPRVRAGRDDARLRTQPCRRLERRAADGADRRRGDRARRPRARAGHQAMSARLLVLQHAGCEPPGVYEDVLRERGIGFERLVLDETPSLPDAQGWAGIVAMGGAMGAYEEQTHPWLA